MTRTCPVSSPNALARSLTIVCGPWLASQSVSESPSQRAMEVCISIGLLCWVGVSYVASMRDGGAGERGVDVAEHRVGGEAGHELVRRVQVVPVGGEDDVGRLCGVLDDDLPDRAFAISDVSATTAATTWPLVVHVERLQHRQVRGQALGQPRRVRRGEHREHPGHGLGARRVHRGDPAAG